MSSTQSRVGYVRLGNSGLKVSKIILGCMSYGSSNWADWVLNEEESMTHFKAAFDMGINTWDPRLTRFVAQILVGKAIKKFEIPREELVILSKVHMVVHKDGAKAKQGSLTDPVNQGYVNLSGNSRKHIFDGIKASLKRLDLDYVDVLQIHRFDPETPIEETMDALHDVVKLGYARYIGMSSCYAYQFHAMQNYAKSRNQTMFISMQDFYNAAYREEEREMFPVCKMFGVGIIPWSPLARGYLTRPYEDQTTTRASSDANYTRFVGLDNAAEKTALQAINAAVAKVAEARGITMAQVALAWVSSNKNVTAPIVGTTKLASLQELAEATHISLTPEEIESISAPYHPRGILGHS